MLFSYIIDAFLIEISASIDSSKVDAGYPSEDALLWILDEEGKHTLEINWSRLASCKKFLAAIELMKVSAISKRLHISSALTE